MRPAFETPADRANELEIVETLLERWECDDWHKLNPAYSIDFALLRRGHPVVLVEIKNRPTLHHGYGDGYYLSSLKVMRALSYAKFAQLPLRLVVRFRDRSIWRADLDGVFELIIFGRSDPRDEFDHEPCCVIPWSCFTLLRAAPEQVPS